MTTFHYGVGHSLRKIVRRAHGMEKYAARRARQYVGINKKWRNSERYKAVAAEAEALGIAAPERYDEMEVVLRLHKTSRRKVTLPTYSWNEPMTEPREQIENECIERIKQCIELLEFSLEELSQIPNPNSTFVNRVSISAIVGTIRKLRSCTHPPLPDKALPSIPQPLVAMPLVNPCILCDGPSRIRYRSEWYCEECAPEQAKEVRRVSNARRERERDIKAMTHDIKSIEKTMREIAEKMEETDE